MVIFFFKAVGDVSSTNIRTNVKWALSYFLVVVVHSAIITCCASL